jgi:heme exporter protein A
MSIRLYAENLTHSFGEKKVFSGIDLSVSAGETVAVTGRNGSGKTTLCRICAGLLDPSGGGVILSDGENVLPRAPSEFVAFISPDMRWYNELTARENLEFFTRDRAGMINAVSLSERFRIADALNEQVGTFSSGMRQRLSLAAFFSMSCVLRIMDEPSSHLDEEGKHILWELLSRNDGIATIIATHDWSEISRAQRRISLA